MLLFSVHLCICIIDQAESLTVNCRGSVQVTTVCLLVDRWLFSPTLDIRQTSTESVVEYKQDVLDWTCEWQTDNRG